MRIANNIMALNTHRFYTGNNDAIAKSAEKLSSGYRINSAGDDAAGLAISEKMRAQIRGLNMAARNGQDAISLIQTAEGALQEVHTMLQRMNELAVQSASDTNEKVVDRGALQQEFAQMQAEINDIARKTVFNDQRVIDGTFSSKIYSTNVKDIDPPFTPPATGSTFKAEGGTVMLSNKASAGIYEFSVIQRTVGAAVGSNAIEFSVGKPVSADVSQVTATPATNVSMDSNLNGTYKITIDAQGSVRATNDLGKVFEGVMVSTGPGATSIHINFSGLGTVDFTLKPPATADTNVNGPALTNSIQAYVDGQRFSVSGAATPDLGETRFYATMSGASSVEIREGDKAVTFDNGITVIYGKAFTVVDLEIHTQLNPIDNLEHADDAMFPPPEFAVGGVTVGERRNEGLVIQTGANEGDELRLNVDNMDSVALGVSLSSIATRTRASRALTEVKNAINQVSTQRAALGALSNRLSHQIANLKVSAENLQAAESRIRDVDIASEMSEFTKKNILSQASTAMLAQANASPQNVLSLLQ